MIVDHIENLKLYSSFSPYMESVSSIIDAIRNATIDLNKHEHEKLPLTVIHIVKNYNNLETNISLERHQKYSDLHFIIDGKDDIGILHKAKCSHLEREYDEQNDYMLYSDRPESINELNPSDFMIITPEYAHSTLNGVGFVNKIVIKIPIY
jgi:YhcH/YjgK/YiaL family protein